MDNFEKVEKLVQKAGVSYADAKRALEEANGDLLDAMIILEQSGKTGAPEKSTYSTQYEEQTQYVSVPERVETGKRESAGSTGSEAAGKFKEGLKKLWHALSCNFLVIKRHGEKFVQLPLWGMILILLAAWHISLILIVISLFFGYTYSFKGEADLEKVNDVMGKASKAAEKVKEEFTEDR